MVLSSGEIVFKQEPITLAKRLDEYAKEVLSALRKLLDYYAARIEEYAKVNAIWIDRTGNARQGIRAFVEQTAQKMVLYLVHSVFYGVFLELRYAGRYAIIAPTLEAFYGEIQRAVQRLVK